MPNIQIIPNPIQRQTIIKKGTSMEDIVAAGRMFADIKKQKEDAEINRQRLELDRKTTESNTSYQSAKMDLEQREQANKTNETINQSAALEEEELRTTINSVQYAALPLDQQAMKLEANKAKWEGWRENLRLSIPEPYRWILKQPTTPAKPEPELSEEERNKIGRGVKALERAEDPGEALKTFAKMYNIKPGTEKAAVMEEAVGTWQTGPSLAGSTMDPIGLSRGVMKYVEGFKGDVQGKAPPSMEGLLTFLTKQPAAERMPILNVPLSFLKNIPSYWQKYFMGRMPEEKRKEYMKQAYGE